MSVAIEFAALPSLPSSSSVHSYLDKAAAARVKPVPKPRPIPPAPLAAVVEWLLFDRRVVDLDSEEAGFLLDVGVPDLDNEQAGELLNLPRRIPVASTATTFGLDGETIRSDLYQVPPPMCSIAFIVRATEEVRETREALPHSVMPTVVGTDADRILMQFHSFPYAKLFVYTADRDLSTVELLPECTLRTCSRMGPEAAILSRRDEYGVAFLQLRPSGSGLGVRASVTTFRSTNFEWAESLIDLPSITWTDPPEAAVSHRDCICWAFYSRGKLLLCDVLKESPGILQMNLPPSKAMGPNNTFRYRAVAVAENHLKFMDIDRTGTRTSTHVNIWSLDDQGYTWSLQGRLEIRDCTVGRAPIFPLPCANNADIIFFMTPDARSRYHRIYAVNWRTAAVLSYGSYAEDRRSVLQNETAYLGSNIALFSTHPPALEEDHQDFNDGQYHLAVVDVEGRRSVRSTKDD